MEVYRVFWEGSEGDKRLRGGMIEFTSRCNFVVSKTAESRENAVARSLIVPTSDVQISPLPVRISADLLGCLLRVTQKESLVSLSRDVPQISLRP